MRRSLVSFVVILCASVGLVSSDLGPARAQSASVGQVSSDVGPARVNRAAPADAVTVEQRMTQRASVGRVSSDVGPSRAQRQEWCQWHANSTQEWCWWNGAWRGCVEFRSTFRLWACDSELDGRAVWGLYQLANGYWYDTGHAPSQQCVVKAHSIPITRAKVCVEGLGCGDGIDNPYGV